ncbi:MFS transporter [Corynebacterium callunae]|uniref:MFS transporter n=1 Tax=Corynebacterium callunae TaxID=1721 RepID=UPI003982D14C
MKPATTESFPQSAATTPAQRWGFLAAISAGLFLIGLDNSILYTALPELRSALETTETQALWIINAYPLMMAGLLLGTGTLGDKIGHQKMFLSGLIIFGLASLTAAFSPTAGVLIAARAFLGIAAAAMMPATLALIRITFTAERERNTAIGVWGSVAIIGAALGPIIGGTLLEYFWWGSVFLINVPVAIIAVIATIIVAPGNIPNPEKQWDFLSSLFALFTLAFLILAIKEAVSPTRSWAVIGLALIISVGGAVSFSKRQKKIKEPLFDASLFRNPLFSGGVIAAGFSMFAISGIEMTTSQRFQLSSGFSPLEAGLLMLPIAIASFPMSIIGGANLHRWGFRNLICGGFIATALGICLCLWGTSHSEEIALFSLGLLFIGVGTGAVFSVASTAIIGSAPVSKAGMASSVEEVSYEFGTLLSVAILGSLFPTFYALHAPSEVADNFSAGVHDAVYGAAASAALDTAYLNILTIALCCALFAAAVTAFFFRGNPKGTSHAHQ